MVAAKAMEGLLHAARSGTQCSHLGGTQRTNACAAKARSFSSPHSAVPPCGAALIPGRTITSLAGSATRATRCSSRYHSCWGHSRLPMGNVDTWSSRRQHAQRTPQAARGDQPAPISKPNLGEAGKLLVAPMQMGFRAGLCRYTMGTSLTVLPPTSVTCRPAKGKASVS